MYFPARAYWAPFVPSSRNLAAAHIPATLRSCRYTHTCELLKLLLLGEECSYQSIIDAVWRLALLSTCSRNYFYCFAFQKLDFKMCLTSQIESSMILMLKQMSTIPFKTCFCQSTSLLPPSSFAQNCGNDLIKKPLVKKVLSHRNKQNTSY